jgi:bifunctional UDP-N-acetylglucosamine pyrophosphorylase/glucosamine-1-phosphate N-acetyltransferase
MRFRAVILAAGKGTRMLSDLPKVMHTVRGRPMLWYPVQAAADAGADEIAVVVGHGREIVESWLAEACPDLPVSTWVQTQMLGTADAVRAALGAFEGYDGAVLILYGDVPNLPAELVQRVLDTHAAGTSPLTMLTAHDTDEHQYGRVVRDEQGHAAAIVEFRDADEPTRALTEVNIGVYAADAGFLAHALANTRTNNAQREFYLTDMVAMAAAAGTPANVVVADDIAPLHGVNTQAQLAEADALAARMGVPAA